MTVTDAARAPIQLPTLEQVLNRSKPAADIRTVSQQKNPNQAPTVIIQENQQEKVTAGNWLHLLKTAQLSTVRNDTPPTRTQEQIDAEEAREDVRRILNAKTDKDREAATETAQSNRKAREARKAEKERNN